jgi:hypothetical protein
MSRRYGRIQISRCSGCHFFSFSVYATRYLARYALVVPTVERADSEILCPRVVNPSSGKGSEEGGLFFYSPTLSLVSDPENACKVYSLQPSVQVKNVQEPCKNSKIV